jgi:hypothetical protein
MRLAVHMRGGARLAAALAVLALFGCRDISPGHIHPDSVIVQVAGETVVVATESTFEGELEVAADASLSPVTVIFLDHDGDPITIGPDHFVRVTVENTGIAEFEPSSPGSATGQFHGRAAGDTTAELELMHGRVDGRHHRDWGSAPVPVRVVD